MLDPITATRVVAKPASLGRLVVPVGAIVLRIAPDEALVIDAGPHDVATDDPHAIVTADPGWRGTWLGPEESTRLLEAGADWRPSPERPTLAQGMLFQLPAKLWLEHDRVLVLAPHVVATELETRIGGAR